MTTVREDLRVAFKWRVDGREGGKPKLWEENGNLFLSFVEHGTKKVSEIYAFMKDCSTYQKVNLDDEIPENVGFYRFFTGAVEDPRVTSMYDSNKPLVREYPSSQYLKDNFEEQVRQGLIKKIDG